MPNEKSKIIDTPFGYSIRAWRSDNCIAFHFWQFSRNCDAQHYNGKAVTRWMMSEGFDDMFKKGWKQQTVDQYL